MILHQSVHQLICLSVLCRAGDAAGVLFLALFLPGEHGPELVQDRGGDAGESKERLVNTYTAKRRWSLCEKVLVLMTKR